jgi:putative ABC transport system permease protein
MAGWRRFILRVRSALFKSKLDRDLSDELDTHLQLEIDQNARRGMAPDDARRAALRSFGGVEQTKDAYRDHRGLPLLDTLFHDALFGLRMLRKNAGFSAVAILTLALGIGATTAIFSVVYAVLLRPLPYLHPGQLVGISEQNFHEGVTKTGVSYLNLEDWRRLNHVFTEIAGMTGHDLTLTGRGEPTTVHVSDVTAELFSLLEASPLAGRTFLTEDGKQGAAPVAILSENLWRNQFGADPKLVGSTIDLDKHAFTVVGIMPAGFRFPLGKRRDVWIPLLQDPLFSTFVPYRDAHFLGPIARLKPGVSVAQAQAEMDTVSASLAREFPAEDGGWTTRIVPLQQEIVGNVKSALLVLLGAVGLVLLIACANIANLLLARATSRTREIAVRIALGAGRARIVRQLLTESAVLGLLGGVAGIGLAFWGVRGLSALLPAELPQINAIRVDGWVLAFALLLSVAASFIFGLAPALLAADSSLQTSLKSDTARSGEGGGRRRARSLLASAEIALAMVLLIAAGLLIRSFATLLSVSPGFNVSNVVKTDFSLPRFQYSTPQQWSTFSNELLDRIQAEPGLRDTAFAAPLPLVDQSVKLSFGVVGAPPAPRGADQTADFVSVSPDYFRVMGIPLLRGRIFTSQDSMSAPRVTLISETMAQHYFPNENPLGKRLAFGFPPNGNAQREIVGIVGDVRDVSLSQDPSAMMYVPFAQAPFWGSEIVVKSTIGPSSIAATIRGDVRRLDKDLPVGAVQPMADAIEVTVSQPRFRTLLLSLFGAMALVLAAAGIFGVVSYSVSSRTREIGIRMALGATPAKILRLILAEAAKMVLLGLAIGLPTALVLARFLSNLLFAVRPADPLTFAGVAALLALVALAASYLPTRRAMRVDPMVALRYE